MTKRATTTTTTTTSATATSPTRRRGRRPHPARNARLISTGAAATLTLGVVAALTIGDVSAASRVSSDVIAGQAYDALAPVSSSDAPAPATILIIRRVHYLPPATTAAPVPPTPAASEAAVFAPKPAVRANAPVVRARKTSTVRNVVAKRRAPTRRARRATRAS